ncbi:MAG: pyridoxal-phosphate dependent enzyme, partial [Hyphomicrobiales bacterium]|nr:pyridoxal-phosphate dependent enzyme [Hyphomicrobiales bacterium]
MSVTLEQIQNAASILKGKIARTPLLHSSALSQTLNANIHIKHENLQPTHSFKVRGARVKMET